MSPNLFVAPPNCIMSEALELNSKVQNFIQTLINLKCNEKRQ